MTKTSAANFETFRVELPASVIAIIRAAGGHDPSKGGMPYAMASIVGALPWIAVAMYRSLPLGHYAGFAKQMEENIALAMEIVVSDNPEEAFERAYTAAKRAVN